MFCMDWRIVVFAALLIVVPSVAAVLIGVL